MEGITYLIEEGEIEKRKGNESFPLPSWFLFKHGNMIKHICVTEWW